MQFSIWDISNFFRKEKKKKIALCLSYTTSAILPCPEEKQNRVALQHYWLIGTTGV